MAFLWSLWPLNLNRWLFQLKLLHMIHISWKNYEILKFWVLDFGFGLQNFFWPLKVFLRSLVSKKSSGMQKSYVWAIFHTKQFSLRIFHSGLLWKLSHFVCILCRTNQIVCIHIYCTDYGRKMTRSQIHIPIQIQNRVKCMKILASGRIIGRIVQNQGLVIDTKWKKSIR